MNESIFISLIFIFIYIFLFINKNNTVYVEAQSGTKFLVHKDEFSDQKANLLSQISERMYKLKNYLFNNINKYPDYRPYIELLNQNLHESRTIIYETDPDSNLTSYSVNKGEEVSFCLMSKKTKQLHTINLMMYVAIHEMAHMACPEIGHGDLFKKIFRMLVEVSMEIDIYKFENYNHDPVEYCGMILSSTII